MCVFQGSFVSATGGMWAGCGDIITCGGKICICATAPYGGSRPTGPRASDPIGTRTRTRSGCLERRPSFAARRDIEERRGQGEVSAQRHARARAASEPYCQPPDRGRATKDCRPSQAWVPAHFPAVPKPPI